MSSGGIYVSVSSSRIGVARYAPATALKLLACVLAIIWMTFPRLFRSGSNHTAAPYVIVGRTVELYKSRALENDAPHVDVTIFLNAASDDAPFF